MLTVTDNETTDELDTDECPGCIDSDAEHDCGYVNDECPEGCAVEHDTSPDRYSGQLECPATEQTWRYCEYCGWQEDRWNDGSTRIDGDWLCEPYEHGYTSCDDCGDLFYHESGICVDDSCYCSRSCAGLGPEGRGEAGELIVRCYSCGTGNDHAVDLLTERFLCECKTREAQAAKRPVLKLAALA